VPEHLKTLYIATVSDVSGFGNPAYKDLMTQGLIDKFQGIIRLILSKARRCSVICQNTFNSRYRCLP